MTTMTHMESSDNANDDKNVFFDFLLAANIQNMKLSESILLIS